MLFSSSSSKQHTDENFSSPLASIPPPPPQQQQREAERLLERAARLRAEARDLEMELRKSQTASSKQKGASSLSLASRLFPGLDLDVDGHENDIDAVRRTATESPISVTDTEDVTAPAIGAMSAQHEATSMILNTTEVARVMRDERWSVDQAMSALEALRERRRRATGLLVSPGAKSATPSFNIGDTSQRRQEYNEVEFNRTQALAECLIEASAILDAEVSSPPLSAAALSQSTFSSNTTMAKSAPTDANTAAVSSASSRWSGRGSFVLKSRWNEWVRSDQKDLERLRLIQAMANPIRGVNSTVDALVQRTLGLDTSPLWDSRQSNASTRILMERRASIVPFWVPSTILPYVIAARAAVSAEDVRAIKERVLSQSRFFCTSVASIPSASIFRGNIRVSMTSSLDSVRNASASVFEDIQRRMDREGISERVQLLMIPDPEWRPGRDTQDGPSPKPVFLAISNRVQPDDSLVEQGTFRTAVKRFAVVATMCTVFAYSVSCLALNQSFFNAIINLRDPAAIRMCAPIVLGILAIQVIHEAAHCAVARRNGMKLGLPIPLPSFELGLFGCITPLRSFPPNRTSLFDFALSGPASALLASMFLMVVGAFQTIRASHATLMAFPFVSASILRSSLLSGSILAWLAPKVMMMPLSQPVPVSPLFLVGLVGSISSALNLLPMYRLDGGRACASAMGSRFAAVASAATLLFLLSISFNPDSFGIAFWWGMAVVFLQRKPDVPARDDVTELDDFRFGAWLASLAASILTLAPFPGGPGIL
jgi:hypothetical protein